MILALRIIGELEECTRVIADAHADGVGFYSNIVHKVIPNTSEGVDEVMSPRFLFVSKQETDSENVICTNMMYRVKFKSSVFMKRITKQIVFFTIIGLSLISCGDVDKESVKGITLNCTSMEMKKNTTDTLYATIAPSGAENKSVKWESDNSKVMWIGGGTNEKCVVRAVAPGNAHITATTQDGGFVATCTIEVYADIEKMYLTPENLTLEKGERSQLKCSFIPMDAKYAQANWSSSNPNIVFVSDNGEVTANNGGNATVTATSADGLFSKACEIFVRVTLTGITLDKSSLSLVEGETAKLNATLVPEDTTSPEYYWDSSNPSVLTVNENGELKALKAGTAIVSVTTRYKSYSALCTVAVEPAENVDYKPYDDEQKW